MAEVESKKSFPTEWDIESAIPAGRIGYIKLATDLTNIAASPQRSVRRGDMFKGSFESSTTGMRAEIISSAIGSIATYDSAGLLKPPLPTKLSELLQQAAQGDVVETEERRHLASLDGPTYNYRTVLIDNHSDDALLLLHSINDYGLTNGTE